MEQGVENRITEGLLDWSEKENRLRGVFGNNVIKGRSFLEGKRDYFVTLYNTCRRDATPEEKIMLGVLKDETRKLNKLIHPNPVVRSIAALTAKVKAGIKSYYLDRSVKRDILYIKGGSNKVEYDRRQTRKNNEKGNEVRESPNEALNIYKRKRLKNKAEQSENKTADKNDKSVLPQKSQNRHRGRSIY